MPYADFYIEPTSPLVSLTDEPLLDIEQAARVLAMSEEGLRTWVRLKMIEYVKVGNRVRFKQGTLREYIDRNTIRASGRVQ